MVNPLRVLPGRRHLATPMRSRPSQTSKTPTGTPHKGEISPNMRPSNEQITPTTAMERNNPRLNTPAYPAASLP